MIRPKADKNASEAQNLYFEPLDGLIVVEGNDWSQYIIGQGNLDRLNHQSFFYVSLFLAEVVEEVRLVTHPLNQLLQDHHQITFENGDEEDIAVQEEDPTLSCLDKRFITVEGGMRDFQLQSERACLGCYVHSLFHHVLIHFDCCLLIFCVLRCQIETKSWMTESKLYCRSPASLCFGQDAHFFWKPTHSPNSISHLSFN